MGKITKKMMTAVCCVGVLALGCVGLAQAGAQEETGEQVETTAAAVEYETQSPTILAGTGKQESADGPGEESAVYSDRIRIWGPVLGVEEGMIRIDNQSGISSEGEILLNISEDYSLVLDAVNGFPVSLSDIQVGEFIYAYIGPAMTMSLPPMTTAEMVICQIPADFRAPDYVKVKSMQQKADESWTLTATDGTVYQVPSDCEILPYLTRNLVRLNDVTAASDCLVWTDEIGSVRKIVLFAQDPE
ncbi:MAG: hypothetical protein HFG58_13155 [Lachnospiraceae bacterium]|nr:hypothetical protein [Lachnospiraceae bacterium]